MKKQRITFCQMTLNNFDQVVESVRRIKPYVDRIVIVDGGSIDGTIPALRAWKGIELHIHPWADNFVEQRNNCLSHCAENGGTDFILFADPDEWIPKATAENLQEIIMKCSNEDPDRLSLVRLKCREIYLEGTIIVEERRADFFKPLFFRHHPNNKYTGWLHESLSLGMPGYDVKTMYEYYHVKERNSVYVGGARNLFIGGGVLDGKSKEGEWTVKWKELRKLMKDIAGIESWSNFNKYLICGNIDQKMKDLIIKNNNEIGYEGASNWKDLYITYFKVYHPEEKLEKEGGI